MTDSVQRPYEQLLVLRCQAGDEAAFAELVERFHPRLAYYVRRLLGDAHAAEDVLQDVWLTVYRKLATLRDPQALRIWLYRIARRAVVVQLRHARRWRELDIETLVDAADAPDEAFGPDDAARIHAALARLEPSHRDVLVLRFVEELSYEDIAQVTGCPLGTVRSRLHYAKRALCAELGG
jgi:RNA polymerase sigma-70 factor, ECF subfamily